MTAHRHTLPHQVCLVFRGYPSTIFWIATCAAFAAGTTGSYILLGVIFVLELAVVVHIVSRRRQDRSQRHE